MPARKSIAGKRFVRWTVINDEAFRKLPSGQLQRMCHVICDCGNEDVVSYGSLVCGDSESCKCLHNEQLVARSTKHEHAPRSGLRRTYSSWHNTKQRCRNPNNPAYPEWGGRGIKMCDGWFNSYKSFLADNGECPPGLIIDRRDNDGHYSCGHCEDCLAHGWVFNTHWVTYTESARNTRRNRKFTVNGITGCIAELCEHFGVNYQTAHTRIQKGWSPERVFQQPRRPNPHH